MKSKLKHDALLKQLLKIKPKGKEDFWLFSLVIDDPNHPTWEQRFAFIGTYEQGARDCVAMTHVLACRGFPKSGIRIETYHGEAARRYLAESVKQETRYQQERTGQPNN